MNKRIYPLKFFPIFKEKVWGGRKLREIGKDLPENQKIGEIWELVDRPDSISIVSNGYYANKSFRKIICELKDDLIGTDKKLDSFARFPLLIKYIDAAENLSVQVHPDDAMALKFNENDPGKTEFWYIFDTQDNPKILCGCDPAIKNITDQRQIGKNLDLFKFIDIQKGDLIFIPAGQVHALLKGTVLLEIQENSDITYRFYDWDRIDESGNQRELHFDKAINAIKTELPSKLFQRVSDFKEGYSTILDSSYFKIDLLKTRNRFSSMCDGKSYKILIILDGYANFKYGTNYEESLFLKKTDIILLPASLGNFSIETSQCTEINAFFIS